MMKITHHDRHLIEVQAEGTLDRVDYERIMPALEHEAASGELRLLVRLEGFRGWTPQGLVDDLRFDLRHHDDFSRIAIVGHRKVEEWGTRLAKPFFSGEMRFFEELDAARAWLRA